LPLRLLGYETARGRRRLWRELPGLERLPSGRSAVALTFDDGPGELTSELVETLGRHRLKATFFLLGEQARDRPEVARALVAAGHEIGLHGFEHFRHDRAEPERSVADILRGFEELEAICSVRPRWYRPPWGRFSAASFDACGRVGLRPAYWSVWGWDWEPIGASTIARRVRRGLEAGAIVLLHDSARYSRGSARETLTAVSVLADDLRRRGLATATLSEAAGRPSTRGVSE
jgi:peptidoglycan/xylan/chitin deacetylase (PgdA/CDA1 family)